MATIINTPPANESSNGMTMLVGVGLIIALVFFLIYFGFPMLRRAATPPQVSIPDKVDVNINTSK